MPENIAAFMPDDLHVYESNDRAIRFYEREGFTVKREQTDKETGEKELEMIWRRGDS